MKNDSLKKFAALRTSLVNEQRQLEQRLAEINAVLGSETQAAPETPAAPAAPRRSSASRAAKPRRPRNAVSLKLLVKKVTTEKPLTKEQILAAVKKEGYRFTTDKPFASINVVLYTKGQFKNTDGKFSPAK